MRSRKHVFFAMAACAFLSMGCSNFFGLFFSHSITYHANGGIGSDSVQSVEPNEDAKLIKNAFTRAGYSFLGWSPNAAASRPSYYDEAIYAVGVCDVDLYAVWALTADCRTITYHANGGVGEDSVQNVKINESANLVKNTFTRAGYSFLGWSPNAAASQPSYYDEAIYAVGTSDVALYAIWAPVVACRTITYHANGGVGEDSVQSVTINESANLAKNTFTRAGYSFLGWSLTATASQPSYYDEAVYAVGASDVDLYAIWALVPVAASHTITFKAASGTGNDANQTVVEGKSANLKTLADLGFVAPAEQVFGGWASSAEATVPEYTDGQSITMGSSDLVLYAVWGTRQLSVMVKTVYDSTFVPPDVQGGLTFGNVYSYTSPPASGMIRLSNDGTVPLRISSVSITQGADNPYAAFTLEGVTKNIVLAAGESAFLNIVLTGNETYNTGTGVPVTAIFKIKSDDQDEGVDGYTLNLSGNLGSP